MSKPFPDETLLARWLNGELSQKEEAELKTRADYDDLRKIVEDAKQLSVPAFSEGAAWEKLVVAKQSQGMKNKGKRRFLRSLWWSAAAAVLALVAIGYWWMQPESALIATQIGEQLQGSLPDGSTYQLNAVGTLDYDEVQWSERREVVLNGEAFFQVEKGSEFTVRTSSGEVSVLGTSFNVWARGDQLEVVCYSGKVRVIGSQEPVEIEAGQKTVLLEDGNLSTTNLQLTPTPSWFRGWTDCEGLPLSRVLEELERQYQLEVKWENESYRVYQGGFPNDDLEQALKFICDPMELQFELSSDKTSVRIFAK
ncbi:MAG: FecR domain-containing protein [Saprospiraceae bacterium]|nr:FecR domain-containing protein [Saprospiraceae bacterium]